MRAKFNLAQGNAVYTYKNDNLSMEQAFELVRDDDVISFSITKQTTAQYLKKQRGISPAALSGQQEVEDGR